MIVTHWKLLWQTLHMHMLLWIQPRGFVYSLIRELRLYQKGLLCGMPWQQIINEVMNQTDALRFTSRATNSKTPPNCTHSHTHTCIQIHTLIKINKQQDISGSKSTFTLRMERRGGEKQREEKKNRQEKIKQKLLKSISSLLFKGSDIIDVTLCLHLHVSV